MSRSSLFDFTSEYSCVDEGITRNLVYNARKCCFFCLILVSDLVESKNLRQIMFSGI